MEIRILLSVIAVGYLVYTYWGKDKEGKVKEAKLLAKEFGIFVLFILLLPNALDVANSFVGTATRINPGSTETLVYFSGIILGAIVYFTLRPKLQGFMRTLADCAFWTNLLSFVLMYFLIPENMSKGWVITNMFFFVAFVMILVKISGSWNGTGRITFGVAVTYALNVILSITICFMIGNRHGIILMESSIFLVAMLCLQVIFFWLACGVDAQEKNLRKRKSYWINKAWMIGCMFWLFAILKPLMTGEISTEELLVIGDLNMGNEVIHQLKLERSLEDYSNVSSELKESLKKGDLDKAYALREKAENALTEIAKVQQQKVANTSADVISPVGLIKEGASKTLSATRSTIDWTSAELDKWFPPKPPSADEGQKNGKGSTVKTYPPGTDTFICLKEGETTKHWITFPNNINTHFDLFSDNYKFVITYEDGTSYNVWELKKLPVKNLHKFKITAVTDQKIRLIVT